MKDFMKNNLKTRLKGRRVLALLLAVLMLTATLAATASCESASPPVTTAGEETTAEPSHTETTGEEETTREETSGEETTAEPEPPPAEPLPDWAEEAENEDMFEGLPSGVLDGKTLTLLYWSDVEMHEFRCGEMGHEWIDYKNFKVETQFGVNIEEVGIKGNHGQKEEFTEHVLNDRISGARKYDLVATYSRTAGLCMINGLLADLNRIENSYIDLSRPWWPASIREDLTVDGSLYFLSGDISVNFVCMLYGIFCNTELIEELGLDDPTELLFSGAWTVERMMELTEDAYRLMPQNAEAPFSGFVTEPLYAESFYHGADYRFAMPDDAEGLVISREYGGEAMQTYAKMLLDFLHSDAVTIGMSEAKFRDGKALFTQNRLYLGMRKMKEKPFEFTILPLPMYGETQDGYRTTVGNPVTLYGILGDVEAEIQTECSLLIECLAAGAYHMTTPRLFTKNYVVREADEDYAEKVRSFEIIREGAVLDYGRILPNDVMEEYMSNSFVSMLEIGLSDPVVKGFQREFYEARLRDAVERIRAGFTAP